jgi:N-acetylglucosamine malate deacetylase 1
VALSVARKSAPRALALFAHPDDVEFRAAGTLLLLAEAGFEIHYATMTAGDLGALTGTRAKIAAVRKGEARRGGTVR